MRRKRGNNRMAAPFQIVPQSAGITCHAWNRTYDKLALCPNNNELHIYENCTSRDFSTWKKTHVLTEHDFVISGISWSHTNDKIVTSSHDRNAFVWKYSSGQNKWLPTLCNLRVDRAAISCEWSPDGTKFAVGTGSKCVPVCYYVNNKGEDFYASKMIKKHKSTILQVAWHPNSQIIATVSSDRSARVLSAPIPESDTPQTAAAAANIHSPFPNNVAFGDVLPDCEWSVGAWTTAVAWSPSGTRLCFAAQDSCVRIITFGTGVSGGVMSVVRLPMLPLACLKFVSESAVIGGGYDMAPLLISCGPGASEWSLAGKMDGGFSTSRRPSGSDSKISAARSLFQAKTSRGEASSTGGTDIQSHHTNPIMCLQILPGGQFSTTATDGKIVLWDLQQEVAGLSLSLSQLGL